MKPTVLSGTKLLILVGDGGAPESFVAPCGITTTGIGFAAGNQTTVLANCADPDRAPWEIKDITSLSAEVSGAGVMAVESFAVWNDWFQAADIRNVQIKLNDVGYWSGAFGLSALKYVGERGQKITVDVTLLNSGPMAWVPAATLAPKGIAAGIGSATAIGGSAVLLGLSRVFLTTTGAGTWTVPSDFGSLVSVECIAGGGGGNGSAAAAGGGAYAKITSTTATLTPSSTISYSVGAGGVTANGGDTWWNASSLANAIANGASASVGAQGGRTNSGNTGGAGGSAASSVGTTKYSGGSGGDWTTTAGGGGGAAGPLGAGGTGAAGGTQASSGGGGNSGGTSSTAPPSGTGGSGGDNAAGKGHGTGTTTNAVNGTAGGGGGGAGVSGGTGGVGGSGFEWDVLHGSGGGGGGEFLSGATNAVGGLYGGGAGGRRNANGAQGIIVITYNSTTAAARPQLFMDVDIDSDIDDVVDLVLALNLEHIGKFDIIGCCVSSANAQAAPTWLAIANYYGRASINVGVNTSAPGNFPSTYDLASSSPYLVPGKTTASNFEVSTITQRRALAAAPDGSVTYITTGDLSSVNALLATTADGFSALNGSDLVKTKIKEIWVVAGNWPSGGGVSDFGSTPTLAATSASFLANWPTQVPIIFNPINAIGTISTGATVMEALNAANPARVCWEAFFGNSSPSNSRSGWSQTALMSIAYGIGGYQTFAATQGTASVNSSTGVTAFSITTNSHHNYTVNTLADASFQAAINALLKDPSVW